MIREGFFVTPGTQTRQRYRTEPLYRWTFILLLAIGAAFLVTVAGTIAGKFYENGQAAERERLAGQEAGLAKEEERLQSTGNRITALAAFRRRIEKRTPAARVLWALEDAAKQCPNICLRQVDLESASDEKAATDVDRWNIKVQAVTRARDQQTIADFRDALNKNLSGGSVNILDQPNFAQAQPPFSLQGQYPR